VSAAFGQTRWLEWVVVGCLVCYVIGISTTVVKDAWRNTRPAVSGE